jgi:hypothetical protein
MYPGVFFLAFASKSQKLIDFFGQNCSDLFPAALVMAVLDY